MTTPDDLEGRLRTLDLRFGRHGGHVDEERLASLVAGRSPAAVEAEHLAGCDGCVDLLVGIAAGLDVLTAENTDLANRLAPLESRPPRSNAMDRAIHPVRTLAALAQASLGSWFWLDR